MSEQISMVFEEDVKLSSIYEILQSLRTPQYLLGYEEKYEIYRKKGVCIQLNVYFPNKIDGCEKVIKKGVYLKSKGKKLYTISSFSNECLSSQINYDNGIKDGGGRCDITQSTMFLKWFVNQALIYDDMGEIHR